jgi:hypothetical protein
MRGVSFGEGPSSKVSATARSTGADKRARVGFEWVHSLVDDHSRLAYSELHRDEKAATVTAFVERGLAFYAAHGIEAKRLISDNAWTYPTTRCSPNCSTTTASATC